MIVARIGAGGNRHCPRPRVRRRLGVLGSMGRCNFFQWTDVSSGETWRRFPVTRGDILLGDRGYSNPNGVRHVVQAGRDVIVRPNRECFASVYGNGKRLDARKTAWN